MMDLDSPLRARSGTLDGMDVDASEPPSFDAVGVEIAATTAAKADGAVEIAAFTAVSFVGGVARNADRNETEAKKDDAE